MQFTLTLPDELGHASVDTTIDVLQAISDMYEDQKNTCMENEDLEGAREWDRQINELDAMIQGLGRAEQVLASVSYQT
jgi:hypothetical protein